MKREFRKFFGRRTTLLWIYLVVISFAVMIVYMGNVTDSREKLSGYFGSYKDRDQLNQLYLDTKSSYEENKSEYAALGFDNEPIKTRLLYFEYLLDNYIEEDDGLVYSQVLLYESRDSLSVFVTVRNLVTIIVMVSLVFLVIEFFVADFTEKRHLLLYSGRKRMQIICDKVKAYVIAATVLYLVFSVLGLVYTLIYSESISTVLFMVGGRVVGWKFWQVVIAEILSGYIRIIPYMIAFMAFGIMTRNSTGTGLLSLLFFGSIAYLPGLLELKTLMANLGMEPFYSIAYGDTTIGTWLGVYAVELAVVVVMLVISTIRFKRVNLA